MAGQDADSNPGTERPPADIRRDVDAKARGSVAGVKEARACLFAGLFFVSIFLMPRAGLLGIPRYNLLLIIAVSIQAGMIWAKLETLDELKAICLFHVVGFVLEAFKTSGTTAGIWQRSPLVFMRAPP